MITNEVQHRATKCAVRAQAGDLRAELEETSAYGRERCRPSRGSSLADLATLLVKARIARGWTQRRLAEALGVAEQQVQRDESTDYRSASLARICDVAAALDVAVTEKAELQGPHAA